MSNRTRRSRSCQAKSVQIRVLGFHLLSLASVAVSDSVFNLGQPQARCERQKSGAEQSPLAAKEGPVI